MYTIVHVDARGNRDSYMAGDPTPGGAANEFETEDEALEAIDSLDDPDDGCRWAVEELDELRRAARNIVEREVVVHVRGC